MPRCIERQTNGIPEQQCLYALSIQSHALVTHGNI